MKHTKKRFGRAFLPLLLCLSLLVPVLAGCSGKAPNDSAGGKGEIYYNKYLPGELAAQTNDKSNTGKDDKQDTFIENPFIDTSKQNVSTFSADVDTASYALFRKSVNYWLGAKANRQTILSALSKSASSFRTEEFLNYFRYDAKLPGDGELFGTTVGILPCPWNEKSRLLRLTLQAPSTTPSAGNNLVFLIDVSGSMSDSDKLPLLKTAFSYLTKQLTERDRVSIVT